MDKPIFSPIYNVWDTPTTSKANIWFGTPASYQPGFAFPEIGNVFQQGWNSYTNIQTPISSHSVGGSERVYNNKSVTQKPPRTSPKTTDANVTHEPTTTLFIGDLITGLFSKPIVFHGHLLRTFPGIKIKECLMFNRSYSAYAIVTFGTIEEAKFVKSVLEGKHYPDMSVKNITVTYRIPQPPKVVNYSLDDTPTCSPSSS